MNHIVQTIFALLLLSSYCYAATSTLIINATIYDHSSTKNPDFENHISSDKGLVKTNIGQDRKPIFAHAASSSTPTVHNASTFNTWFRDTPGINLPIAYQMVLTKGKNNNIYTFSDTSFFPLDNKGFGNEGRSHNYHFCLEMHSSFTYVGKEVFTFTGDDDVFVFINSRLVIDLGGIHSAQSLTVALDALGLTKNTTYKFDLFFCERHTTQSNLQVQTTMKLFCEYVDRCGVCEGDGNTCPCTCDDGNDCTTDYCDIISGECAYTGPKDCDANGGTKSGYVNTGEIVGIVVGGTAFVGISILGGKKAYEKYSDRKKGVTPPAASTSSLFAKYALKIKPPKPVNTV